MRTGSSDTSDSSTKPVREIHESELSYRRLFEAARDGIMILDVENGRIRDVNPFLVELLGFSHKEMVGKTVGELSPFKDLASNRAMLKTLQEEGYVRYDDLPLETKDGRKIAVEFVSNVYQEGLEKVIQCNIRDITERRRTENSLIRLAGIVEYSDDAIISRDLESIVTSWNRGAEKVFGYKAEEIVGSSITRLIPVTHLEEEKQILARVAKGESIEYFDTIRQSKDGRLIEVSLTVSPIKDSAGHIIGVSKVARDITERKAIERRITQLNVELEQRVAERTGQLLLANKELEVFSYSVSHDLRAPLRHIMGFVELLEKEAKPVLTEKSLRFLAIISQSAIRMGNLIDDLLTFSRVGKAELNKTDVDQGELVRDVMAEFEEDTRERKIVWNIGELPRVHADRALLRTVWVNLLSNAVKFTGARAEAQIDIGCNLSDGAGNVFYVRDNGAGFDPKYAGKLFGVFQRLHRKDEFDGTGIGLANVQRVIHRHDGKIWAEGTLDQGASFYFTIPDQSTVEAKP